MTWWRRSLARLGGHTPVGRDTVVAAYRLVQEALTNARQRAPGAEVVVHVEYRATEVVLSVHNGAGAGSVSSDGGGHGLVGMRERVRRCGGSLSAGPAESGG